MLPNVKKCVYKINNTAILPKQCRPICNLNIIWMVICIKMIFIAYNSFSIYIFRVTECIKSGQTDISIAVDGGKHYQAKVEEYLRSLSTVPSHGQPQSRSPLKVIAQPQPPVLPISGWKPFPSTTIPSNFSYDSIYRHMITTATVSSVNSSDDEDGENHADFGTAKPLRKGRYYYTSGHVHDLQDRAASCHYFIKSLVRASYSDKEYHVTVTLALQDAKVVDSSCDCRCSAMGRCSHVSGLLFALEDFTIQFGYHPPSCTSKLAKWNVGRKTEKDPQPAHVTRYTKKAEPDRIIHHDPRPVLSRTTETNRKFTNKFLATITVVKNNPVICSAGEVVYDDYVVDAARLSDLKDLVTQYLKSMRVMADNRIHQVEGTDGQADSDTWKNTRRWLVTASTCKRVSQLTERGRYTFLRNRLFEKELATESILYGKHNEKTAFNLYKGVLEAVSVHKVKESGLWVNPDYPGFGASPDGLVYEADKLVGILEIKCPMTLQKCHPGDAARMLSKKQMSAFCCAELGGTLKLKQTHPYYYQVQMQMAVCGVLWCDFTLWSQQGLYIDRVHYNSDFWETTAAKLTDVYQSVIIPEFFEMRVPRRLLPIKL